jgi:hypothetical protein
MYWEDDDMFRPTKPSSGWSKAPKNKWYKQKNLSYFNFCLLMQRNGNLLSISYESTQSFGRYVWKHHLYPEITDPKWSESNQNHMDLAFSVDTCMLYRILFMPYA